MEVVCLRERSGEGVNKGARLPTVTIINGFYMGLYC